jgi:MoaA/NifB/PqqE/SkfB family radical SAM enzyme/surfactin synthase thioesterase subunit
MTANIDKPCGELPIGIILVHGYRGTPADLAPLESSLVGHYGAHAVESVCLPGHGAGLSPFFDEPSFLATLAAAIDGQLALGRRLVLLGHSTGGSLLLAEIARRQAADPSCLEELLLLVLCATPPRIDLTYAQRWAGHTADRQTSLDDVAAFVSLINRLARRGPMNLPAPVLVVHGDADELVPVADADLWRNDRLIAAQRQVRIAGAKHHLFSGQGADMAIDTVRRAIDDARQCGGDSRHSVPRSLFELMPGLELFVSNWPDSAWHVKNSPAGRQAVGEDFEFADLAASEPTLANIEITTRCNLGCVACARTQLKLHSHFMSRDEFRSVLAHMPHTFRIVLVGLGEPLMHPEVIDFIKLAVTMGRRVGLVTNGMFMDVQLARALCQSGLAGITFSLDTVDQTTANRVRVGSDVQQISANIRMLTGECRKLEAKLGTSVFTALRSDTIDGFEAIIEFVADHELDALMVTDLNFRTNQALSVNCGFSPEHARTLRKAIRRAVARRLPVLSVWGLEEFALDARYMDFLLFRGEQLAHRSERRSHCASPWQSLPVRVDGNLTVCDCQPEAFIGNIFRTPLTGWWNGPIMREHRESMLGDNPPTACLICPRF